MDQITPNSEGAVKPPDIFVAKTLSLTGRGVFALRQFEKDELVEVSPIFLLKERYEDIPTEFQERVFAWVDSPFHAVALGYGSLYNHRDKPNLKYESHLKSMTIRFIAIQDIDLNEELTINYNFANGKAKETEKDWFEKLGIKKYEG